MAKLWLEAWTRPGDAAYGRKIAEIPVISAGGTLGYSGVFPASMQIPKSYSRLNEILFTDATTPANGVWSTIKLFSEGTADPIYEWLPSPLIPASSKQDPSVDVSGNSIDGLVNFARVEPWDWDGSANFVSTFPDWIWGGRNLLGNPGFEDSPCRPEVNEIVFVLDNPPTPMTGSFFVTDGVDSAGSFDVSTVNASDLENALEADIAAIDDVVVSGTGAEDDPFVIEFVTPCLFPGGLQVVEDPGDPWADGYVDIFRTQFGALMPTPWTKSQTVSDGTPVVHGDYDSFRVTTAFAHSGTFSLLIDPAVIGRRYAGAQQILNVEPNGLYQASVWVRTNSASQEYRFVIRGIDEDLLLDSSGNPALLQMTLSSGVWTQFSIPNVEVGDNTRIILRIANINVTGNPAIFYVDDGEFNEGQPPTTVGQMFSDLYDDATINHPPRIVWEDESAPTTMYFTLDFDGTNDSDGVAWDRNDVALTFRPRMSYGQVLGEFVREGGYEWRVVAGPSPGPGPQVPGYYLLQLYNPGTLGGVVAAGIQGGSTDVSHNARYFSPNFTNLVMQGAGHQSARASNAGLLAAFGRIEGSELDLNVTSLTSAVTGAVEGVNSQVRGAESLVYTLRSPAQEPLVLYRPGDEISVEDPPIISDTRRVAQIEFSFDKFGPEYTVYLGSESLVGQTAINHQVGVLLRRFQQADEPIKPASVIIGGGGGAPTVVIATVGSSAFSQSRADFILGEDMSPGSFQQLLDGFTGLRARILFTEGEFDINLHIDVPIGVDFEGMGQHATRLNWGADPDITFMGNNGIRHIQLREVSS